MRQVHFKNRHEPLLTCCLSGSLSANPLLNSCRLHRVVVCAPFPARSGCWKGLVVLEENARCATDFSPSAALTCPNGLAAALDAIAAVPMMEHNMKDCASRGVEKAQPAASKDNDFCF